uniref:Uncharacterized protein n=1 Tax=Steinernema glaseri TaxID=37863 RepID=A0A1I7Z399_9BILA
MYLACVLPHDTKNAEMLNAEIGLTQDSCTRALPHQFCDFLPSSRLHIHTEPLKWFETMKGKRQTPSFQTTINLLKQSSPTRTSSGIVSGPNWIHCTKVHKKTVRSTSTCCRTI